MQLPDENLREEWDWQDVRAKKRERKARDKDAFEQEIAEILRRPRTSVRGWVKKENKILIDSIKAKIIALDPDRQIEELQQRPRMTRSASSSLSNATRLSDRQSLYESVLAGTNYQKFSSGIFVVNLQCHQEALGIFYEVNTIRIIPELYSDGFDRKGPDTTF